MYITISRLERARKQYFLLKETRAELEAAYNTYKSPELDRPSGTKGNVSKTDLTAGAVYRIDDLQKHYNKVLADFTEYMTFVMNHVSDPLIESIIVRHYFCGCSWNETKVYHAKKRVYEYIETHYKELNNNEY